MKRTTSFFLALGLAGALFAQQSKVSPEFGSTNSEGAVDIIVKYKTDPGDDPSDRRHQKVIKLGGHYKSTHHIIQSASYRLNPNQLSALAKDPDVEFISPDHPLSSLDVLISGESTMPQGSSAMMMSSFSASSSFSSSVPVDYFRETVHADVAIGEGWNGTNIGVALIDSGITVNEDLKSQVSYSQSFVPGDSTTTDGYGHGTHVAGILAGLGVNSSSVAKYQFGGAAPGVNLINLRVLDAFGNGTDSAVINAIQRAISLKNAYNIRVINLSLGRPVTTSYTSDPLCQAVEAAWNAGITVVVAAGNEGRNNSGGNSGYGTILVPGNDPYVITVGAMKSMETTSRNDDLIASYSSKGPTLIDHVVKPDLVAPGNLVISVQAQGSTLATLYPANNVPTSVYSNWGSSNKPNRYFTLSGTSMSAPVVAGAVASLLEKNPSLTPDQVKARLMKTASKSFPTSSVAVDPSTGASYISYYDIFTVGAGYLDVTAALSNNDPASGSAQSPTAMFNTSNKTASLSIKGNSLIWGSSLIWGNSLVWGSNVLVSGSSIIWGSSLIWGDCTVSGLSLIWGDSIPSGSSIIWGRTRTAPSRRHYRERKTPMTIAHKTLGLIGIIGLMAAAEVGYAVQSMPAVFDYKFWTLLVIAVSTARLKVKLPGINGNMSVSLPFLLIAGAQLGMVAALLVALPSCAVQCLPRGGGKPKLLRMIFNLSTMALAVSSASLIGIRYGLPGAAGSFFFAQTVLVAAIIRVTEGGAFHRIWSSLAHYSFPFYVLSAGIASIVRSSTESSWRMPLVILIALYAIYRSYQSYFREPAMGSSPVEPAVQ